jgi:hypothetical protein
MSKPASQLPFGGGNGGCCLTPPWRGGLVKNTLLTNQGTFYSFQMSSNSQHVAEIVSWPDWHSGSIGCKRGFVPPPSGKLS